MWGPPCRTPVLRRGRKPLLASFLRYGHGEAARDHRRGAAASLAGPDQASASPQITIPPGQAGETPCASPPGPAVASTPKRSA